MGISQRQISSRVLMPRFNLTTPHGIGPLTPTRNCDGVLLAWIDGSMLRPCVIVRGAFIAARIWPTTNASNHQFFQVFASRAFISTPESCRIVTISSAESGSPFWKDIGTVVLVTKKDLTSAVLSGMPKKRVNALF